jgi:hypothetical protein
LERFQGSFENTDKEFLKKDKSSSFVINSVTCGFAHLRLNLSSKEIAPLLNISVRSVEIKDIVCVKNGLVA